MEIELLPVKVKQEPSEEFLLILPPATEYEQEFVPAEVKREPSEDYVLILPPATETEPETSIEDEREPEWTEVAKPKRKRSKKLAGSSSVFKCNQCSYQTDKKRNLTQHKEIHNKTKSCESCQKKFATNRDLKRHQMQNKHGIYETSAETFEFDCASCDNSFCSRCHLVKHQRNVHDENDVKCKICGTICKSSHRKLKVHIERMHLLKGLVSDSKRRANFSDLELLEELQFKHSIVTMSSETQKSLNQYKKAVHAEKTFECETCKTAFKTRSNLNQHKANVHLKVSCSICRKQFGQRSLQAHMKLHLPGHHFECDFCGNKYVKKEHLKRHIDRRHRNEALKRNIECREDSNGQRAPSSLRGNLHGT